MIHVLEYYTNSYIARLSDSRQWNQLILVSDIWKVLVYTGLSGVIKNFLQKVKYKKLLIKS